MAGSLRLRLAVAAALSIAVALVIARFGLAGIFESHVIRRVEAELAVYLRQLAAEVSLAPDARFELLRPPSDPRFEQPLSGLYWQVEDEQSDARQRSRSLWDYALVLPARKADLGAIEHLALQGPGRSTLLAAIRSVAYKEGEVSRVIRLAVAVDRTDIEKARADFVSDISRSLLLLACILIVASWTQIHFGLRPLEALRQQVRSVRAGSEPRLAVEEPTEVMPLVAEVNSLLEARERAVEVARQRASDLAHGLKTPLQVLAMDAERLRQRGETEMAAEIEQLVNGMRRHVGRELSRARMQPAASVGGYRVPLGETVDRLVYALSRGPKGRELSIEVDVAPGLLAPMAQPDLMELIGNLLDNAVKWAATTVWVNAGSGRGGAPFLVIEDDGAGVSGDLLASLGKRGVRFDETVEGTGLGLAIATDIADAYAVTIRFGNREPNGFRVEVTFNPVEQA